MRLSVLAIAVLAAVAMLAGCGGADTEEREGQAGTEEETVPANLPDYTVMAEEESTQAGQDVKNYAVSTDATSEEDLRALTLFFRSEAPEADAVVVSFYPNEATVELSGAGYAFASEEAARAVLGSGYTDTDIARIMQDDGVLVTSVADTLEEITSSVPE